MATKQGKRRPVRRYRRASAAERRARAALGMSPAQLRFTPVQAQVALGIANTKFWREVQKGRIAIYRDGKRSFVTRDALEQYERARREAARLAPPAQPCSMPGHRGVRHAS